MSDPFIGTISIFGFSFPPRDWTACSGQLISISQSTSLYSLLGTYYGGDGRTTFGIPELRGRMPISHGRHPGSIYNYPIGAMIGTESYHLDTTQLPSHTHTSELTVTGLLKANKGPGNQLQAGNNYYIASQPSFGGETKIYSDNAPDPGNEADLAGLDVQGAVTINNTGGSQPVANIPPITALNFSIAMLGLYPPRN
ncbi:phage tail protein [Pseudomonadota bacterium]